tara:strand:+ start:430 stop:1278 length:849 start_codon:yes stop_codon:yes gene_type:complete
MPNGKSIYDVYAGAGKSMGAYESSLRGVQDVWGDIQFKQARTAQRGERREARLDTLLAATELGSTLYGGWQAQQEFKQETLPGMQKIAAKEAYAEGLGMEKGAKKWKEFAKTDPGKAFLEEYAPKQVGKGGKQWGEMSAWEKMWQKPMYQFGEGEGAYTIGKSAITGITQLAQAGGETDISQYREAISGGTATEGAKTKTPETKTPATKTPATTLPTLEEKEEPVAKGAMGGGWDEPEPVTPDVSNIGDFEMPSLLYEASMEYLNKNKPGYQRPRGGGGRMY